MRTAFITGTGGFIGFTPAELLLQEGWSVAGFDGMTDYYDVRLKERRIELLRQHPKFSFTQAMLEDNDAVQAAVSKAAPDVIIHLAAQAGVPADPTVQFAEPTAYDPRSPYSASKAASDHLVRAWHETYGLHVVLSNCSNNCGPYHFPEKLIPVVVLNALAGRALPIYVDGSNIRDRLYVEDHADALLLVATKDALGRSYNISGENERTNLQLVQTICAILDRLRPRDTGAYADLITFVTVRPGHDARYAIDLMRTRTELGWPPSMTLEEGLERNELRHRTATRPPPGPGTRRRGCAA